VYTKDENRIYQHLYVGNRAEIELAGGKASLRCETEMPWEGGATVRVAADGPFELALRVPGYARDFSVSLNGKAAEAAMKNGYAVLRAKDGDTVRVDFTMEPIVWRANPRVTEDCGKVCLTRGPLVYCAEEIDNGALLQDLWLDTVAPVVVEEAPLFGGIRVLKARALRTADDGRDGALYAPYAQTKRTPVAVKLIPYYLWNNRGAGEMTVWMNRA
jgi:hypothetical protein